MCSQSVVYALFTVFVGPQKINDLGVHEMKKFESLRTASLNT